jgi:tryptophan-rich hypothetical protein
MNRISPKKLLNSKWTAAQPRNKEKHFLVTAVNEDADGHPETVTVEAVHSHREIELDWRELKDLDKWRVGWV